MTHVSNRPRYGGDQIFRIVIGKQDTVAPTVQLVLPVLRRSLVDRSLSSPVRRFVVVFSERPPSFGGFVDPGGGRQLGRDGRLADEPLGIPLVGGVEHVGAGGV